MTKARNEMYKYLAFDAHDAVEPTEADAENVTIADFYDLAFKDVYVVVTKMFKSGGNPAARKKMFSYETMPNTPIAAAMLFSADTPILFARFIFIKKRPIKFGMWQRRNKYPQNDVSENELHRCVLC